MKRYWTVIKEKIKEYVVDNWSSDSFFDKGKIVFIGVVLFFIFIKIIYSIFS